MWLSCGAHQLLNKSSSTLGGSLAHTRGIGGTCRTVEGKIVLCGSHNPVTACAAAVAAVPGPPTRLHAAPASPLRHVGRTYQLSAAAAAGGESEVGPNADSAAAGEASTSNYGTAAVTTTWRVPGMIRDSSSSSSASCKPQKYHGLPKLQQCGTPLEASSFLPPGLTDEILSSGDQIEQEEQDLQQDWQEALKVRELGV